MRTPNRPRWDNETKVMGTGRRCEKCFKPIEQNRKRTKSGHPKCFPELPVIVEGGY